MASPTAWRCGVCGYIHRGDEPPEWCPVCGAYRDDFEPYEEPAPAPASVPTAWRCLNCGHVHGGGEPPEVCPVCAAGRDRFDAQSAPGAAADRASDLGRAIVVGGGIAGLSAAEAIRAAAPEAEVLLVCREPGLPYYRLNLTRYLAGEVPAEALPIHPGAWYETQAIDLVAGAEAAEIDPGTHSVRLSDGTWEAYDRLVITAGAHPFVPPIPGSRREGVTALRTIQDADRILGAVGDGVRCVCLGGGILGLETAGALARRGAQVTILEGYAWLLARQLCEGAGRLLARLVGALGIDVRLGVRVQEILGDERVRSVLLEGGDEVRADLVVITTGVRPNSHLARSAGLGVNQGIIVDDHMKTSAPDILAAGDVAEHRGTVYGLWAPAQFQGSIAGMNAAGLSVEFGGIPRSNTLKVLGIDLFSVGLVEPQDASFRVVHHASESTYFQFLFRDAHLVGAILLGDTSFAAQAKRAVEERTDWSAVLRTRPSAQQVLEHLAVQGRG